MKWIILLGLCFFIGAHGIFADKGFRNPFQFESFVPPILNPEKSPSPAPLVKALSKNSVSLPKPPTPPKPTAPLLTGVFTGTSGRYAILNSKVVASGEHVDGWRVLFIDAEAVTLEKGKSRLQLTMTPKKGGK